MATVQHGYRSQTVYVPTVVDEPTVTLTLTLEEAEALTVVLSRVGGLGSEVGGKISGRQHITPIADALEAAGFDYAELDERPEYTYTGTLGWFVAYPVGESDEVVETVGCCGGSCGL